MSLKWRKFSDKLPDESRSFLCKDTDGGYLLPTNNRYSKLVIGDGFTVFPDGRGCGCCAEDEVVTEWAYIEE